MKKIIFCLFVSIATLLSFTAYADGLMLTMVDVGSAECLIITIDGETMVVDAGYTKSWNAIESTLQAHDVSQIKYFALTHPHADHIGSATRILNAYPVEAVLLPPIEYDTVTISMDEPLRINTEKGED